MSGHSACIQQFPLAQKIDDLEPTEKIPLASIAAILSIPGRAGRKRFFAQEEIIFSVTSIPNISISALTRSWLWYDELKI